MWKYLSWPQAFVLAMFFGCGLLAWVAWTSYVVPKDKNCHEAVMDQVEDCSSQERQKCMEKAGPLLETCVRIDGKTE